MSSEGLKRRRPEGGAPPAQPKGVLSALKNFDVYAKVHDDYRVKTDSGGVISFISILLMLFLFANELSAYLTVDVVDHIIVDTSLNQKLPISLNITFPHLRCDEVSVDTVDSAGENQINIHGTLHQIELGSNGKETHDRDVKAGDCLSCMEAADPPEELNEGEKQCCNTCQQLKDAYQDKGIPYYHILDTASQCKDSQGCRVYGDVLVNKVGGNVHVALGKSTIRDGKHVHEFNIKDVSDGFNTSHIIHRARFGAEAPGISSPLEGTSRIVRAGAGMFHYYIKLVPTLYSGRDGSQTYTNQYAVTDSAKNVMVRKGELTGLPGIFLVYEFNPFMVERVEKAVPLSHFLTQVCAIIGGVFTVAGLVDDFFYRGMKKLLSKGQ